MIFFVQSVVSGVLTGLLYGLVALSFVVVYRGARIVNLAQGELLLIGGFSVWLAGLYTAMPSTLGPLVGLIITAFSGVLIERLVFRPLIGRPMTTIVLASIALMIILRGVIQLIFGAQSRPFPQILPSGTFIVYDIQFNVALCFGAIITIIATEFLHWFFMHTMVGLRLAAVAEDHLTSLSIGISVKRASAIAWMLGSLLAALASIVYLSGAPLDVTVASIGLRALPVALLGGMESIRGATLAGILIGIGESLSASYLDRHTNGTMSQLFPFIAMICIMLIRPQGLFGWKTIERV